MIIQLPNDLEGSLRAAVVSGQFASEDDAVTAIVREYFQRRRQPSPSSPSTHETKPGPALGSIGAMKDAADELDQIVEQAMRNRRVQPWRIPAGE